MENFEDLQHYIVLFGERLISYIPTLIGAFIFLIFGLWLIRMVLKLIKRIFQRRGVDLALQNFSITFLRWTLRILLFVMFITQLGLETTSLVAALGAAGLAIGLALQGSLSNLAGGVLIILLKPFRLGDWIEVGDVSGSVKDISLFYTKLNTFGNQLVVIPNGELSNSNVINYSGENTRREDIVVGISYGSDIKKAKEVLLELLLEQPNVLKDPAPTVLVSKLSDYTVDLSLRYWASNDTFWDVHFYTIEEAKRRLEGVGITIPVPQQDLYLKYEGKKE